LIVEFFDVEKQLKNKYFSFVYHKNEEEKKHIAVF